MGEKAPIKGVGERIRAARQRAELSPSELARRLGVSHTAINNVEEGSRQPSADLLFRISEVTGVSTAELLGAEAGVRYGVTQPERGFLENKPRDEWPPFLTCEAPTKWPGTLRTFVGSVAADMMLLSPDEVPLLAKMGQVGGAPMDEAAWVRTLSMLRLLIGAGGRPVLIEMVDAQDDDDG